jgi:Secretion system C-terminal sorting domain
MLITKYISVLVFSFMFLFVKAQNTAGDWIQVDKNNVSYKQFNYITTDTDGDVIATGLGLNLGFDSLSSGARIADFIGKFNGNTGKCQWLKMVGVASNKVFLATHKRTKDIFVASGAYYLNTVLDLPVIYDTSNYIVVARINTNGTGIWAKAIPFNGYISGGTRQYIVKDFTVDTAGNSYISFQAGNWDDCFLCQAYIAKLKPNGDLAWIHKWTADVSGQMYIQSLTVDNRANLTIVGQYSGSYNTGDTILTNQDRRTTMFIMGLDSLGRRQWMRSIPSQNGFIGIESSMGVATTADGKRLVMTGRYMPDPQQSVADRMDGLAPTQARDFIAEIDPVTKRFKWVKTFFDNQTDARKIRFDSLGYCYFKSNAMALWTFGRDTIPVNAQTDDNRRGEFTGVARFDSTGIMSHFITLGEKYVIGDFDIYKDRVVSGGLVLGRVYQKDSSYIRYNTPPLYPDIADYSLVVASTIMPSPQTNYSIRIDSVSTTGNCYDNPLFFKTTTSTFRAGNRFKVLLYNISGLSYDWDFALQPDSKISLKLDTMLQALTIGRSRSDTGAYLRVCSTNPTVCSPPISLRNPYPEIRRVGVFDYPYYVCVGDTFTLAVKGAAAYKWFPRELVVGRDDSSAAVYSVRANANPYVLMKTFLGCTTKVTTERYATLLSANRLQDSVVIPCVSVNDGVQLLGLVENGFGNIRYTWSPNRDLDTVNYATSAPLATPSVTTLYKLTAFDQALKCTVKDSVLVKVDSCNVIKGKTTPFNTVSLMKKVTNNPFLQTLKSRIADKDGNYLIRTHESSGMLKTQPNFPNDGRFATYADSVLTQDQAKLITLRIKDTTRQNLPDIKSTFPSPSVALTGFVRDFNDPSVAMRSTYLLLVDSLSLEAIRGQAPASTPLYMSQCTTDQSGAFNFEYLPRNRTYYLMADRLDINNRRPLRIRVDSFGITGLVIYRKDSLLINCSDAGAPCGTLSGTVFQSANSQTPVCTTNQFQFFYTPISQRIVKLDPLSIYAATDTLGNYVFKVPPGIYDVSTSVPLYHRDVCGDGTGTYRAIRVKQDSTAKRDIGFQYNSNNPIYDMSASLTAATAFRPGFATDVQLVLRNHGLGDGYSAITSVTFPSDKMTIENIESTTSFSQDLAQSGVLRLRYVSYLYSGSRQTFNIRFRMKTTVPIRDSITLIAKIVTTERDSTPLNNADTVRAVVTGSFDPNDKQMNPSKQILPTTDKFDFLIRFQNTGTDTAFTVVVRDTLTAAWNPASLQTIAASHRYRFAMKGKGIAEWTFDNILLPDSFRNEPASHGFIRFTLQPALSPPLSIGATLSNKAAIFFDYNAPIITNTATGTVTLPTRTREVNTVLDMAHVYPNPAKEKLTIALKADYWTKGFEIQVFNALGQIVLKGNLENPTTEIKVKDLKEGIYFLKITDGLRSQTSSIMVLH